MEAIYFFTSFFFVVILGALSIGIAIECFNNGKFFLGLIPLGAGGIIFAKLFFGTGPVQSVANAAVGIVLLAVLFAGLFQLLLYPLHNDINSLNQKVQEADSNLNVAIDVRDRQVQSLKEAVATYAGVESEIYNTITDDHPTNQDRIFYFTSIGQRFPELKVVKTYKILMDQIILSEIDVMNKCDIYNATAREYNTLIGNFPHAVFAVELGFLPASLRNIAGPKGKQ